MIDVLLKSDRLKITPRARREVRRLNLDISRIKGTGPNGRIVFNDVINAGNPMRAESPSCQPEEKTSSGVPGTVSSMRMAVAKLTTTSFSTVPHFYLRAELDATTLIETRKRVVEQIEKEHGIRVTVTDFILRAITTALQDFPSINSVWQDSAIVPIVDVNIGVLVALEDGMLIPVIEKANQLSLIELALQRNELVGFARSGRLPPKAQRPTAITLSNLGNSRVDSFDAIIPPPQSSILAVGRITARPYVVEGQLCVRDTMKMTLSIDHRVFDGALGAEFIDRILDLLEDPRSSIWE